MAIYMCPPRDLRVEPGSTWPAWRAARRALEDWVRPAQQPVALHRLTRLAHHERPLLATCDLTDATVVATNAALHHLGPPEGSGDWSRWGWEQIARIDWADSTSTITLIGLTPLLPDPVAVTLPAPGPLVDVARERVPWTTQLATRVELPSGGTMRVVVRRHPVTDRMDWFVYPDATIAGDGARFRAELHDVLAALRADTGL